MVHKVHKFVVTKLAHHISAFRAEADLLNKLIIINIFITIEEGLFLSVSFSPPFPSLPFPYNTLSVSSSRSLSFSLLCLCFIFHITSHPFHCFISAFIFVSTMLFFRSTPMSSLFLSCFWRPYFPLLASLLVFIHRFIRKGYACPHILLQQLSEPPIDKALLTFIVFNILISTFFNILFSETSFYVDFHFVLLIIF